MTVEPRIGYRESYHVERQYSVMTASQIGELPRGAPV